MRWLPAISLGFPPALYLIAPERPREDGGDDGAYPDGPPSGIRVFDEFPDNEGRDETGKIEPVPCAAE